MATIEASSFALGIGEIWPHFLQRPRLPAADSGTSKRAPQLLQKKTMFIAADSWPVTVS